MLTGLGNQMEVLLFIGGQGHVESNYSNRKVCAGSIAAACKEAGGWGGLGMGVI